MENPASSTPAVNIDETTSQPALARAKSFAPRPVGRRRDLPTIVAEIQKRFPKIMARLAE